MNAALTKCRAFDKRHQKKKKKKKKRTGKIYFSFDKKCATFYLFNA